MFITAALMLCVCVLFDISATFLSYILPVFLSLCFPLPLLNLSPKAVSVEAQNRCNSK